MSRFLALLSVIFLLSVTTVHAQTAAPVDNGPPISRDMVKLARFDKPVLLPGIMMSSADEGIKYLTEFRGKWLVVNIWATWCPPCVEELPSLNALQYAMGGDKFQVVTISIDTSGPDVVQKYLMDNNLKALKPYIDLNKEVQQLSVLNGVGVPATLIIDPKGQAVARVEGNADWNGPAARAVLEYYLNSATFQ